MRYISLVFLVFVCVIPLRVVSQAPIAEVSILPGWREDGRHMAAVRIQMDPGWKTYWRAPGDAGIPPFFDWTGTSNLGDVRVLWPVPEVFADNGLTSVGYKDSVVIPIELTPLRPDQPIRVNLALNIGVCEEICVPFSTVVSGDLLADEARQDARIRAALTDRPLRAQEAGVASVTCDVTPSDDGVRLRARIRMPQQGEDEYAVIEMGDPAFWVSQAETKRVGDALETSVDVVASRGGVVSVDRSAVRFTVLSNAAAVDIQGCG